MVRERIQRERPGRRESERASWSYANASPHVQRAVYGTPPAPFSTPRRPRTTTPVASSPLQRKGAYASPSVAPHVLGHVGADSQEDLDVSQKLTWQDWYVDPAHAGSSSGPVCYSHMHKAGGWTYRRLCTNPSLAYPWASFCMCSRYSLSSYCPAPRLAGGAAPRARCAIRHISLQVISATHQTQAVCGHTRNT